jgi:asparagine synthase (glutamine-hydrolysing)
MCGIAGIISTDKIATSHIKLMTDKLLHRGPDAKDVFVSESSSIALGHTRLSIIDLSAAANQPFHSANGRYVVVFNGEIYNFQSVKKELLTKGCVFHTSSDTEVIAEAFSVWGRHMVNSLEGMFSIAIADQKEKCVYLFRDRIGKKPLYYFKSANLFAFASEIKSLLAHPAINSDLKIDRSAISYFLHLGYIPEPHTIYSSIHKFPAGHTGLIDSTLNFSTEPYWRIQDHIHQQPIRSVDHARSALNFLLDNAVQKRLVSDVPIGSFLSGGTDSSLISAYATKHVNRLKTFSIGFKENKFDESKSASAVANALKTEHTNYMLTERESIDLLESYVNHFDEPFADTSAIPTMLVSKLARKEVKVALTGDGGDELFQGYGAYNWANRLGSSPMKIARPALRWMLRQSSSARLQRVSHLFEPMLHNESIRGHIFSQEQYFFSQREIRDKLLIKHSEFVSFHYDENFLKDKNFTEGEKQALFDLQYYLKDDLLVKVDRASMYYALECRCPLLDYNIIEFAIALDNSLKKRSGKTKWLLKELLRQFLPESLVERPKWGFDVPLARWLKNDLRYLIDHYLSDETIQSVGLFRREYISSLKNNFLSGKDYLSNRLWVLIVLHKWLLEHHSYGER